MPHRNVLERFVDMLLDILSFRMYFNKKAVLITPRDASFLYQVVRYRVTRNDQGIKILHFENGFYSVEPDGEPQYIMVGNTEGAVYGYDDNVLWNVKFLEKEKAISLMESSNAERYIIFQLFKEASDRYNSISETNKQIMLSLLIIFITGLAQTMIAFFIWNNFSGAAGSGVEISKNLAEYERMQLIRLSATQGYAFPEYDIYPENYTTNKTKQNNILPSLPALPKLPT